MKTDDTGTAAPAGGGTSSTSPAVPQVTLEDKLLQASEEASKIASIFSPAVGQAVQAGVAVEPLISGIVKLIVGLFHHHTKPKAA